MTDPLEILVRIIAILFALVVVALVVDMFDGFKTLRGMHNDFFHLGLRKKEAPIND